MLPSEDLIQVAKEGPEFPGSLLVSRGESLETSCACLKPQEPSRWSEGDKYFMLEAGVGMIGRIHLDPQFKSHDLCRSQRMQMKRA